MSRQTAGKVLISVSMVLSGLVSTGVDLSRGDAAHVYNPDWHPHAIFHDIEMFVLLDFMVIVCLWLLWRRSKEPKVGAQVSTLLMIGFWTPFYWITFVFPDASLAANQEDPAASAVIVDWLPWPLYYNVLVGTILLTMAGVGYWVFRGGKWVAAPDRMGANAAKTQ